MLAELSFWGVQDVGDVLAPKKHGQEANHTLTIVPAAMPLRPRLWEAFPGLIFHAGTVSELDDQSAFQDIDISLDRVRPGIDVSELVC